MRRAYPAVGIALALCLAAAAASADTFACTEAGLDAAIATGGGPHQMNCGPPLSVSSTKSISGSLILEPSHPGGRIDVDSGFAGSFRIFHVLPGGSLELRQMRIAGGTTSGSGGNLLNEGSLTLHESDVSYGSADGGGGGIASSGTLLLDRVTLSFNAATGRGGGLLALPGASTTIRDSAIWGNSVTPDGSGVADGGGLHADGTSDLENTTLSNNVAERDGGGAFLAGGTAMLRHVTVAENTAAGAGGALAGPGSASAAASLFVGSCALPVTSGGGNVASPGASCVVDGPGDQSAVAASALRMEPLGWYGGPTLTHRLDPASAAVDAVTGPLCPAGGADQRGAPRPDALAGAACDAGAFESTHLTIRGLERIAASGDPDPRGASSFGVFESASLSQGHVAFLAVDSSGERSLYLHRGDTAALSHVAGASTPVPGGTGTFTFSSDLPGVYSIPTLAARAGEFTFFFPSRTDPDAPPPRPYLPDRGFYRFVPDGTPVRCAGVGDPIDGGPEELNLENPQPPFDAEPGGVVFVNGPTTSPGGSGLYRCAGGAVSEQMPPTVTLPNGDTVRHNVSDVFALAGPVLWGGVRWLRPAAGGTFARIDDGLYELHDSGEPELIKNPFAQGVSSDARRVDGVTHVSEPFEVASFGGVQVVRYGQVSNDASGSFETTERFHPLGGLPDVSSVVGGTVFAGGRPGSSTVFCNSADLVTSLGGVIEPIVRAGEIVDGKQSFCTGIGRDAAEDGRLAFVAQFYEDGVATSAIYLATLPEPSAAAGLCAGAGLLAALARRRVSSARSRGR